MIIDAEMTLDNRKAITATGNSVNIVDLGEEISWASRASNKVVTIHITTTFDLGTIQPVLQGSADEAFTSPVEIMRGGKVTAPAEGHRWRLQWRPRKGSGLRYARVQYLVTEDTPTTGRISAYTAEINEGIK